MRHNALEVRRQSRFKRCAVRSQALCEQVGVREFLLARLTLLFHRQLLVLVTRRLLLLLLGEPIVLRGIAALAEPARSIAECRQKAHALTVGIVRRRVGGIGRTRSGVGTVRWVESARTAETR